MAEQKKPEAAGNGFRHDWRVRYLQGEALRIGDEPQFLFDDYLVEDRYGLRRVFGSVEKHRNNPLDTQPPLPWEAGKSSNPSLIVYDPLERVYKGWYGVLQNEEAWRSGAAQGLHRYTLYAESSDGLTWEKPMLDLFPYSEHQRTNIVLYQPGATCQLRSVLLNPDRSEASRRFIALVKTVPPGEKSNCIVLMYSADGRKWNLAPEPLLFRGASDGSYSLVHNPDLNAWLIYRRPPTRALVKTGFYAGRVQTVRHQESARGKALNDKRHVSVCMSEDLQHWTHPRGLALPDEIDVSDVDSVKVVRYRSIFLGFIGLMDNAGLLPKQSQLMLSRDGLQWERLPDRPTFIPNGVPGEWDAGQVAVHGVLPEKDHIRVYYSGTALPQKETRLPQASGAGWALVEKDRWVGQQAGPEGGYLLTRQFILDGDRLEINCCCPVKQPAAGLEGLIQAELLREPVEHNPAGAYPGYTMDDCDFVEVTDNPGQVLTWNGSPDVSPLRGRPVYIRFFIRNAVLFTFRILTGKHRT